MNFDESSLLFIKYKIKLKVNFFKPKNQIITSTE